MQNKASPAADQLHQRPAAFLDPEIARAIYQALASPLVAKPLTASSLHEPERAPQTVQHDQGVQQTCTTATVDSSCRSHRVSGASNQSVASDCSSNSDAFWCYPPGSDSPEFNANRSGRNLDRRKGTLGLPETSVVSDSANSLKTSNRAQQFLGQNPEQSPSATSPPSYAAPAGDTATTSSTSRETGPQQQQLPHSSVPAQTTTTNRPNMLPDVVVAAEDAAVARTILSLAETKFDDHSILLQHLLGFTNVDPADFAATVLESGCSSCIILSAYLHNLRQISASNTSKEPVTGSEHAPKSLDAKCQSLVVDMLKVAINGPPPPAPAQQPQAPAAATPGLPNHHGARSGRRQQHGQVGRWQHDSRSSQHGAGSSGRMPRSHAASLPTSGRPALARPGPADSMVAPMHGYQLPVGNVPWQLQGTSFPMQLDPSLAVPALPTPDILQQLQMQAIALQQHAYLSQYQQQQQQQQQPGVYMGEWEQQLPQQHAAYLSPYQEPHQHSPYFNQQHQGPFNQ